MKRYPGVGLSAIVRSTIVACVLAAAPIPAAAQNLSWSALVGAGYTGWTGPYEARGTWSGTLIELTVERNVARSLGIRLGFGGAISEAGGRDRSTLMHTRTQLSLAARGYPWGRTGKLAAYGEAGASVWLGSTCTVWREGSIFDKKLECSQWLPNPDDDGGSLRPIGSGVTPHLGLGVVYRAFGFGVRYEVAGPAMFENGVGRLTARSVSFTLEWVFKRRR